VRRAAAQDFPVHIDVIGPLEILTSLPQNSVRAPAHLTAVDAIPAENPPQQPFLRNHMDNLQLGIQLLRQLGRALFGATRGFREVSRDQDVTEIHIASKPCREVV